MSLVNLSPVRRAYAKMSPSQRARFVARVRGGSPARGGTQQARVMGSWLSEWVKKRKKKGVNLNLAVGKGNLSYSVPAAIDPATGQPVKAGPVEWAKRNPAIVAGVGGGLLLTTMFLLKRKGKRGRK